MASRMTPDARTAQGIPSDTGPTFNTGTISDTGPIDALALVQSLRGTAGQGIDVYGSPMHLSAAELANNLVAEGLEQFLAHEARHGVGNYAVVLREGGRITIMTSPGYAGGYIRLGARHLAVATAMSDALGLTPDPVEADPFGMAFYLSHAPASNFNMLPFTTMFRNLRRLPPGSVVVLEKARLVRFQTYLNLTARAAPPENFRAALEEVADAIAATALRDDRQVALMFSGGAGSLALWLVLRERLTPERLRLICVDQPGTNGPARAVPVARALGAALEILDPVGGTDCAAAEAALLAQLTRDTTAFLSPHVALLGQQNLLILNGQNFDVLTNGNMEVLQEFHEAGYLSDAAERITTTETRVLRRDRAFIANLAFTDAYLADEAFQKLSAPFFAAQMREAGADPSPGLAGALRGMISRRLPNLLSPARYPLKQVQQLNAELSMFDDYTAGGVTTPRMCFDLMALLCHGQLAAKRQASLPSGPGSEILMPAMSAPIASYFIGRPRGLAEANQPKREIYALARALGGQAYRSLIKADPDNPVPPAPPRPPMEESRAFAVAAETLLASDEVNPLLEGLREPAVRAHVFDALDKLRIGLAAHRAGKADALTEFQKNLLIRVGNLLSVLATARTRQAGATTGSRRSKAVSSKEDA